LKIKHSNTQKSRSLVSGQAKKIKIKKAKIKIASAISVLQNKKIY
jgi:hypothetical protein